MVGTAFNTVHANDFSYYEGVNELVQEEPVDALDAERAGQLAAIGIANGQPFAPEERMRGTLQQAARIGAGMARATDTQTRSLLQVPSTVHPALSSSTGSLHANDDGSYDLYFGPTAPEGNASNWIETVRGKSWFPLFRLYGPLQPWFDQTWRVNEFVPID